MKKDEKAKIIHSVKEKLERYSSCYIADTSSLNVVQINQIRRKCFSEDEDKNIECKVVKNTLIRKAMELLALDYSPLYAVLSGSSTLFFSNTGNQPARLVKELRQHGFQKPILKGVFVEGAFFIGDDQLDILTQVKSKKELLGDIVLSLESPLRNVIGALKSAGENLAVALLSKLVEKAA